MDSIPDKDLAAARSDGYQAWLDGESFDDCPYEEDSDFAQEWFRGWAVKMSEVEHRAKTGDRLTKQEKTILWRNRDLIESESY